MDETMTVALLAGGVGLAGALIGGAASFLGTWWASREAAATQRRQADRAFRKALAEKHEEHEEAEFRRYSDHLSERGRFLAHLVHGWETGRQLGPDDADRCIPPALIFVPPEIASGLNSTRAEWKEIFATYTSTPPSGADRVVVSRKLAAEYQRLRESTDKIMDRWAARLRSGTAVLDHPALSEGSSQVREPALPARRSAA